MSKTDVPPELESIPFRPPWTIILLAWIVRLSAGINLLAAIFRRQTEWIHSAAVWLPFEISDGQRIRILLTSILLFMLASGLMRGKRTAWLLTIITLTIAPLLHWGSAIIWPQALINLALIVLLLLHHRYFVTRSNWKSVRAALIICPLAAAFFLVFGTVRLHDLRDETSGGDDWEACAQTAVELILVQNSVTQQPQTILSEKLFNFLRVCGISLAVVGLMLVMRPVLIENRIREENREKTRLLIDQYGKDPLDPYALLNDKSYFFTEDNRVVVPYALSGNIAIALSDPIGPSHLRSQAIGDFARYCRIQDWEPVFYQITDEFIPYYQKAEFSVFKIGEEASLRADQFHLKGGDYQNLRTACNSARKRNFQFRWYYAPHGIDEALEQQLAKISKSWLEKKKTLEMTFDIGSFSLEEIRQNGVGVALDSSGEALAMATWRPFARGNGLTLDLMRALPGRRNVMDFVLVESILYFRAQGINNISLGNAPLANTTHGTYRLQAEEKVVQFLFENLNRIYGYKSLFEFKRKYRPQWRGRYLAYHRGVHLPLVGLALVRVHAPEALWKFLIR